MPNNLVLVPSDDDRPEEHANNDDGGLGAELEAMSTIGRALDSIQDPALRQRILNWAVERWGDNTPRVYAYSQTGPARPAQRPAANDVASDPALSVDSISDLFEKPAEARTGNPPELLVPEKPVAKAPVETVLKSLAADFQKLADEWNGGDESKK